MHEDKEKIFKIQGTWWNYSKNPKTESVSVSSVLWSILRKGDWSEMIVELPWIMVELMGSLRVEYLF